MAEWRDATYLLDFAGRTDNEIKHAGFCVDFGEIEYALLLYEGVRSVVVVRQPPLSDDEMHSLMAFVRGSKTFYPQNLLVYAEEHLLSYMVLDAIECINEFSLTPNGKVDQNALVQRRLHTLQQKPAVHAHQSGDKRTLLRNLWKDLLNAPEIRNEDDLFASGSSSL
ncbi:hypothetical protein PENCOP_c006G08020 [Penicillium coprophilum]|uniref:AMP-binding enzyme C-terminal domain-containing protein n=1 Tax=Penicillium coprophilum TaxID=36646 RepID=A0A1V6UQC1_9EURO|nr:hypothetical protein PENCOP_c006G08020 [Penicillium coprophilum]